MHAIFDTANRNDFSFSWYTTNTFCRKSFFSPVDMSYRYCTHSRRYNRLLHQCRIFVLYLWRCHRHVKRKYNSLNFIYITSTIIARDRLTSWQKAIDRNIYGMLMFCWYITDNWLGSVCSEIILTFFNNYQRQSINASIDCVVCSYICWKNESRDIRFKSTDFNTIHNITNTKRLYCFYISLSQNRFFKLSHLNNAFIWT